jgi:hypothetical protein
MGIVKSLFRRGENSEEKVGEAPAMAQTTPHLFMLTPDAAGIAAYQLSQYTTAREAETYLDEHFRGEIREGTIVFWGLSWLPAPGDDGHVVEPVVIIRDIRRPGQVYTFSFADVGSANDFVRHEMKAGLDLGQVAIYWALQAWITVDFSGRATIIPPNPPRRARMQIVARRVGSPDVVEADVASAEGTAEAGEALPEPEATTLPAKFSGLDEEDGDKVVRILDAGGMRPQSNGNHEPVEAKEEEAEAPEEAPSPEPEVRDEPTDDTIHVQLSDVYGGPTRIEWKTSREALNGLGNFRREHEEQGAFLPEVAPAVEEIKAPKFVEHVEPGGVLGAWANICLAIDQALDAYVATRVTAIIVWQRLTAAIAEAAEIGYLKKARKAWLNGSGALSEAATLQNAYKRALGEAWHNSARALRRAAETHTGHRALRHAWLNISWTLEEAVLAARLDRKERVLRAWSRMGPALSDAASQKDAMDRGLRTALHIFSAELFAAAEAQIAHHNGLASAWSAAADAIHNAGAAKLRHDRIIFAAVAAGEALHDAVEARTRFDGMVAAWKILTTETVAAAEAQEARRLGLIVAWHAIGDAAYDGVAAMYRHRRVTVAMANTGLALQEAVDMKIYHDAMVVSWRRISLALFDAVCKMARIAGLKTAWRVLALEILTAADMQVAKEAAVAAWGNITIVLSEAAKAKVRYDGLVFSWQAASETLRDYVITKQRHEALLDAWDAAGFALAEGATAKIKYEKVVRAWRNAARAFRNAAQAYFVRQMSYRNSWERIANAIAEAAHEKVILDGQIAAWDAVCSALADYIEAKMYQEMVVGAWTAFTDAVREAMPAYFRAVGIKLAWGRASRSLREAAVAEAQLRIAEASGDEELVDQVRVAIEKAKQESRTAKPKATRRKARKAAPKKKAKKQEDVVKEHEAKAEEKKPADAAENGTEANDKDELVDDKAAIELWRFRESDRFESRDEVFHGFESPPGRF